MHATIREIRINPSYLNANPFNQLNPWFIKIMVRRLGRLTTSLSGLRELFMVQVRRLGTFRGSEVHFTWPWCGLREDFRGIMRS